MNVTISGNNIIYPTGCKLNKTLIVRINATKTYEANITIDVDYMKSNGINSGTWTLWWNWSKIGDANTNGSIAYLMRIELREPTPPGSISFDPSFVSKSVEQGKSADAYVTVTNNHPALATLSLSYSPTWAQVEPQTFQLNPSASITLKITLNSAGLWLGNWTDTLLFSYAVSGYPGSYDASLPIRMVVVPQGETPTQYFRVMITVIDEETQDPIPQASVLLNNEFYGKTGDAGVVTFQGVPGPKTYQVTIAKQGYQTLVTSLLVDDNISRIFSLSKPPEEPEQEG